MSASPLSTPSSLCWNVLGSRTGSLCLEPSMAKGQTAAREIFFDLGRKVTTQSQPSRKGSVTMRSFLLLLQLLTGLFEADETGGGGMWDPWGKPIPQGSGTWDPLG
jgi:hypothetical protein